MDDIGLLRGPDVEEEAVSTIMPLWLALLGTVHAGEGAAFDHGHAALGAFYGDAVQDAGVDYAALSTRRVLLSDYVATLASADLGEFSRHQKLAFWINAYNALTLGLILDEGQPASIMDLDGGKVWKTRTFRVAGEDLTLDDIEHKRVRPLGDGRIHAAVNCASKGCPPLAPTPFTAQGLEAELDAGARRWVRTNAVSVSGQSLALSPIFDWFGEDFAVAGVVDVAGADSKQDAAIHFILRYADGALPDIANGSYAVSWADYDWSLNKR